MVNKNPFICCGEDRRDRTNVILWSSWKQRMKLGRRCYTMRRPVSKWQVDQFALQLHPSRDCRPTGHNSSTNISLRCTHNTGQCWCPGGRSHVPCATGPAQMSNFCAAVPTCSSKSSLHTKTTSNDTCRVCSRRHWRHSSRRSSVVTCTVLHLLAAHCRWGCGNCGGHTVKPLRATNTPSTAVHALLQAGP